MLSLDNIKALNIEISSKCNANCPFCSRRQKIRPYGGHLISLSDFKLLPVVLIENLRRITFGGNFGDLCCNPEFVYIAKYVRELNGEIILEGDTNGSCQNRAWWKNLGAAFHKGAMVFALDGLEDTHHRHRKGTNFKKIIGNMEAFIAGGGIAQWQFITFRHNEHQIGQAETMAREMGCKRFYAMPSRDFNADLKPPETFEFLVKRDLFSDHLDKLPDTDRQALCRPMANGTLYIAADGTVHPCCYAHLMFITEHNKKFRFITPVIEKYNEQINFKTCSIEEIIRGPYFEAVLAKSGRNAYCMTKCNKFRTQIRRDIIFYDRFFE